VDVGVFRGLQKMGLQGATGAKAIILKPSQLEILLHLQKKKMLSREIVQIFINLFIYFTMKIGNGRGRQQYVPYLSLFPFSQTAL
jgi:hypothetical protein